MSSEVALPKIKVMDAHNLEGSATGTGTLGMDSPSNTTDGGTSARPKSATSSEGMFPSFLSYMAFSFSGGCFRSIKDVQMLWFLLFVVTLTLTCIAAISGNAQSNGKKSPIKLIRNTPSKDTNGGKPSAPSGRPPTAIDPLSHVCLPRFSYTSSN
jgi:WD repeat-containing protein 44